MFQPINDETEQTTQELNVLQFTGLWTKIIIDMNNSHKS